MVPVNFKRIVIVVGITLGCLGFGGYGLLQLTSTNMKTVSYGEVKLKVPKKWDVIRDAETNGICSMQIHRGAIALETKSLSRDPFICTAESPLPGIYLGLELQPFDSAPDGQGSKLVISMEFFSKMKRALAQIDFCLATQLQCQRNT